ncbi:MAG: sulfite exporter TauE/SafE family protein [Pseudomonadota bacterium]
MELLDIALLIGVGIVAGAWNAVAGGATLFSFPVLMAAGLPPVVANATNFLALSPANLFALPPYLPELRKVGRQLIPILLYSSAGALIGSYLLVVSDPALFEVMIPLLLLAATLLFVFGDRLRSVLLAIAGERKSTLVVYTALFLVSIYGGYFGAGVGVILLALGQLLGFSDFHMANAIKNITATSFMVLSITLFGLTGLIAWPEAVMMMIGSAAGGYLGGRYAKRINQSILRFAVTAFGLTLTGVYAARIFF